MKNLTKRYGSHTAVSNLSFHIETGQIYGFLGPNGAGKSTTMNIMTGCLAATEGEVTVGGYDIFEDAAQAKRRIGYLPERPPLYLDRTPLEYLAFVGQAKGLTGSAPGGTDAPGHGGYPDRVGIQPAHQEPLQGIPAAGGHCPGPAGGPGGGDPG
ncbi:MAG: ATP-binding cassette domain-containing protein [Evtepia gabavorous]